MKSIAEVSQLAPSVGWPAYFEVEGAPGVAKLNVSQPKFMQAAESELMNEPLEHGVVANLSQFQKAFGCKVGQPMVHTPTCKVW